jgi:hypothetical protein
MIKHVTTIDNPADPEEPFVVTSILGELNPSETPSELWTRHMEAVDAILDKLGMG